MTAFIKEFANDPADRFAASRAAEKWLDDHGYHYGPMQGDSPRGIAKGATYIAKWRNLSTDDRNRLDGTIEATAFGCVVKLNQEPTETP